MRASVNMTPESRRPAWLSNPNDRFPNGAAADALDRDPACHFATIQNSEGSVNPT